MRAFLTVLILLGAAAVSAASAKTAPKEAAPPLDNAAVVRLWGMGLGERYVIAKIAKAEAVAFDLGNDALRALADAKVPETVVAAMRERAAGRRPGGSGLVVTLVTADGTTKLDGLPGDRKVLDVLGFTMVYSDHRAAHAAARSTDRKPALTVESAVHPGETMWLVKCDPDRGENRRSVKIGRATSMAVRKKTSPDESWIVPGAWTEAAPGLWQFTPAEPLSAGDEYGLYVQGELFGFGIDK